MKHFLKVGVVLAILASMTASALAAQGIIGSWHGHIKIDASKLPAEPDPAKMAKRNAFIQKHEHQSPLFVFKADHTFVISVPDDKKAPSQVGTWKQTGNSIVIQGMKDGKPTGRTQTFVIAKDGKSFSITTPMSVATFTR